MAKLSISALIATTVLCAGVLEAAETQQDQHLNLRRRLQLDTLEHGIDPTNTGGDNDVEGSYNLEEIEEMELMGLAAWENRDSDEDEADLLIPEDVYNEQMDSDPILDGITNNPEGENDEFAFDYDNRVTNEDEADIYIEDLDYIEAELEYQNDTRDSDEDEADLLIPEAVYNEQMASNPILHGITNNPEDEIDEYAYVYDNLDSEDEAEIRMEYPDYSEAVYNDQMASDPNLFEGYDRPEDMAGFHDDEDEDDPITRDAHLLGMSVEELYSDGN